jgi:hypothetical protein
VLSFRNVSRQRLFSFLFQRSAFIVLRPADRFAHGIQALRRVLTHNDLEGMNPVHCRFISKK